MRRHRFEASGFVALNTTEHYRARAVCMLLLVLDKTHRSHTFMRANWFVIQRMSIVCQPQHFWLRIEPKSLLRYYSCSKKSSIHIHNTYWSVEPLQRDPSTSWDLTTCSRRWCPHWESVTRPLAQHPAPPEPNTCHLRACNPAANAEGVGGVWKWSEGWNACRVGVYSALGNDAELI